MDFDFSDEQKMLRDEARRFLSEACGFARLRRHLDGGAPFDRALWSQLADMGWLGTAIGEAEGGLGFGPLELCVLAEELGTSLAPVPFFSTVCIAAELLKLSERPAAKAMLGNIARGDAVVTLAASATGQEWNFVGATYDPDGRVSGRKTVVADLPAADALLVTASDAEGEPLLLLVDASDAGVQRQAIAGLDLLRTQGSLQLTAAKAEILLRGTPAENALSRVQHQAAIYTAFEQIGGSQAALEMACGYLQQRYAFGRPIAANQAVKHKLADMLIKIELARSNAYYGAWAIDAASSELASAAAAARLSAIEAFEYAAEENLHLHGGIGYTWEADCQFFYRRARLLAASLGNAACWSERLLAEYGCN